MANGLGSVERVIAFNTTQAKDYSRCEITDALQGKAEYRAEHWEKDLQSAFDAGKHMAITITG